MEGLTTVTKYRGKFLTSGSWFPNYSWLLEGWPIGSLLKGRGIKDLGPVGHKLPGGHLEPEFLFREGRPPLGFNGKGVITRSQSFFKTFLNPIGGFQLFLGLVLARLFRNLFFCRGKEGNRKG